MTTHATNTCLMFVEHYIRIDFFKLKRFFISYPKFYIYCKDLHQLPVCLRQY